MKIDHVYCLTYSATGTTDKVASAVAEAAAKKLGLSVESIGFTKPAQREEVRSFGEGDLVVVGTPTYAGDLALAIFSIIEGGVYPGNEGVYHFSNEGVCSWYDFATEIAIAAGNTACKVQPCHSDEFPSPVKRPAFSVLDKTKIKATFDIEIPHWRDSMLYCIKRLKQQ